MTEEVGTLHFVLSPGPVNQLVVELDSIKVWALTNPTKKIVVWYDSLADLAEYYFDQLYEWDQSGPNPALEAVDQETMDRVKVEEKLGTILDISRNNYVNELNGAALAQRFTQPLFDRFKEIFFRTLGDIGVPLENINTRINPALDRFWKSETTAAPLRNLQTVLTAKIDETFIDPNWNRKQVDIRDALRESLPFAVAANVIVKNLFETMKDGDINDLYEIYLFEIFFNRELPLAQNLFTYMVAGESINELVINPRVLPKVNVNLSPSLTENEVLGLTFEKLLNMEFWKIDTFELSLPPPSEDPRYTAARAALALEKDQSNLFKSIEQTDGHKVYGSFNEAEGMINYFMYGANVSKEIIKSSYERLMTEKRHEQIASFSVDFLERLISTKLRGYFSVELQLHIDPAVAQLKMDPLYVMRSSAQITFAAARFSRYKRPTSESTGSEFWAKKARVKLDTLELVNHNFALAKIHSNREQQFLDGIHEQRISSTFDLNIFVYLHQKGSQNLSHVRYPSYSENTMLFVYNPAGEAGNPMEGIRFLESGLTIPTKDGPKIMQEIDVKKYLEDYYLNKDKKIRIQLFGHSIADYELKSDGAGTFIFRNQQQSIGGLNVENFSPLFIRWFNKYLPGISIYRMVLVACNLATFKESDVKAYPLKFLPADSFLDKFIDKFNESGIRIAEIVASNATVSVNHFTGRMQRLRNTTGVGALPFRHSADEVRKIRINSKPIHDGMEQDGGKYKCQAVSFDSALPAIEPIRREGAAFAEDIFHDRPVFDREVLDIPPYFEVLCKEFVKVLVDANHRVLVGGDAIALVNGFQWGNEKILIVDHIPQRVEALRLAMRMAVAFGNHGLWETFLKSYFPRPYKRLQPFITKESFASLLNRIFSNHFVLASVDLEHADADRLTMDYLNMETEQNRIIGVMYPANAQEGAIARVTRLELQDPTIALVLERRILMQRIRNVTMQFQEGIRRMAGNGAHVIRPNNLMQPVVLNADRLQEPWEPPQTSFELVSQETAQAGIFAETYQLAAELHTGYQELIDSHPGVLTQGSIPLLDTLQSIDEDGQRSWRLSFVDSANLEHAAVTVKTNLRIFQTVSTFLKSVKIDHINTAGSSALNLIFGIQALCHWVEYGFSADVRGISNKSLATALEVHFYVNAVGLIQGLGEVGIVTGKLVTRALKPFLRVSLTFGRTGGRIFLSLGKSISRALPIIGFIINAVDLGFNSYELSQNNDPYRRPMLITNTVFSAVGLAISTAAIVAGILGASAVAGPLGLVGLGIAIVYIPIAYLVNKFTAAIEGAKHTGLVINSIRDELEAGTYQKEKDKFLRSPSFIAVQELRLSSQMVEVTYGKIEYQPTSTKNNRFSYHWQPKGEMFVDPNHSRIPIDETYRTILMPHIPGYTFKLTDKTASFSANRKDAEFVAAIQLQEWDPGFIFQKGGAGFWDKIASKFDFNYEQTDIQINIDKTSWKFIFPWGDSSHADNQIDKDNIETSNKQIGDQLKKITYHVTSSGAGRQSFLLPGLECQVNLDLSVGNPSTGEVVWYIESMDANLSNDKLQVKETHVKIGGKQTITFPKDSVVFVKLLNFVSGDKSEYVGVAHLDVKKNRYIYAVDVDAKGQENAIFLFSTDDFAYFNFLQQGDSTGSTIRCVSIDLKRTLALINDVKSFERQGDGLLIVSTKGLITHLGRNIKTQLAALHVVGFLQDWFSEADSPTDALTSMTKFLKENRDNPIVHVYLPYMSDDETVGNVLYYPDIEKYFVLDASYANKSNFLKCGASNETAYFLAKEKKELISVRGVDQSAMADKLKLNAVKLRIDSKEAYNVVVREVTAAAVGGKGMNVILSSGVVFNIYEDPQQKTSPLFINITKIIVDQYFASGFASGKTSEEFVNTILDKFETHHLTDWAKKEGKTKLIRSPFLAFEKGGRNVGFYETTSHRTLRLATLPAASDVTPLGSDDNFAYDILDKKRIYRSRWVTAMADLETTNLGELFFEATAMELIDRAFFVKVTEMASTYELNAALKTLVKLPEIELVWIECKNYTVNLNDYSNVTISTVNVSDMADAEHIYIDTNVDDNGYFFVRQDFDFCIYHPKRNFCFVVKGLFDPECRGVKITLSPGVDLVKVAERYDELQPAMKAYGMSFYPKVEMKEILQ